MSDDQIRMTGWQLMSAAPTDGTGILATLRVFVKGVFSHWETHIVWMEDETGIIHPDAYEGWDWDSYEFWMPLPEPPHA